MPAPADSSRSPETTAEMWARWQRESETRLALFNASLPSRDDGLPSIALTRPWDRLGFYEYGR